MDQKCSIKNLGSGGARAPPLDPHLKMSYIIAKQNI